MKKATILVLVALVLSLVPVAATTPIVQIQVPREITAGDEITVTITITHRMNDKNHHVNYVYLYDTTSLVMEWVYSRDNFVTEDQWTLTYTTVLTEDATFLAVAHCTLHGNGEVTAKITVKPAVIKQKAVLLANDIDYTRATSLVKFLEDNGFEVVRIAASELGSYKTEKLIIILGGADTPDDVGNVVKSVLNEREQDLTRNGTYYFLKTDVWASGQRIFVFAGMDRDQTKQAHEQYRTKILE